MRDFVTWKKTTVQFWERRRISYNLVLIAPTLAGYLSVGEISAAVGDSVRLPFSIVVALFCAAVIAANLCYSLVYALEFHLGTEEPNAPWIRIGRHLVFIFGVLISIAFAFIGARNIAMIERLGIRF